MTTSLAAALVAASALAGAAPAAPARHPFTVEDLLSLDRVGEPALSPDGATLAFIVSRPAPDGARLTSALWLVPAAGGEPVRLTHGEDRVRAPRFSPDGRSLAFVSSRGGEQRVWLLPVGGTGEAAPAPRVPGGVGAYRFTPDGRALLVAAEVDPACGADLACNEQADKAAEGRPHATDRLLFRHWDEWRTRKRTHLLLVPLAGGAVTDLTPGDRDAPPVQRGGIDDVAVSPDGGTAYVTMVTDPVEATSTNGDLYAVPLAGGAPRRLTSGGGWDGSPRPSPDGARLAWLSMERAGYEADRLRVLVAAADGSGARELTAGLDASAESLWWVDGGRALRFTTTQAGRTRLYEVAAAGGPVRDLTGFTAHLPALAPSRDGRSAAALVDSLSAPAEAAVLSPCAGGKVCLRALTRFGNQVLDGVAMGAARPFSTAGKDGTPIHGWLVTPPGHRPGQRHPGVVLVHGGPQGAWNDAWTFRWNAQVYAAKGWTVVLPNPRGSTGHGQAYTDAVRGDWGGVPYDDIMRLTDAAVASGELDGGNACAAGASYGGYMINWINGHTDRFRCLVTHAGEFDSFAAYFDTEELWFPEWEKGLPWERREAYQAESPSTFLTRWKTPTLVTHGALDYRVTLTQGLSTFTALQRRGVESRLLVFPDENHWILKPRNSRVFHQEVLGWIERHLAPAAAPADPPSGAVTTP